MVQAQSVHDWPKLGIKNLQGDFGPSFLVPQAVHTLTLELSSRCDVAYMNYADPVLSMPLTTLLLRPVALGYCWRDDLTVPGGLL